VKPNGEAKEAERATKQRAPRANGYAGSVILELGTQRTAALRELVAQQPEAALTALLHALVDDLFFNGRTASCLGIIATEAQLDRRSAAIGDSKAGQAFAARHAAWVKRLPEPELCWQWLVELDVLDRMMLLAHCVALTINAREGLGSNADVLLSDAAGLDMRMWWKPTRANFLNRLTKNEILETVSEGVSQQTSWRLAGLKKERMAKEAEKLLADSGWLPLPLRRDNAALATGHPVPA
jgi:ParB family chromosome partitioning protein